MPLSSSSIFHFTNSKNNLKGILKSHFKIGYCLESIKLKDELFELRFPMVSFCDIPLSEIKDHIQKYGEYGIGLTKEWAIRNELNPVLYVNEKSHVASSYIATLDAFISNSTKTATGGESSLIDILRYMKNYEADLTRSGKKTIKNYRFSDEREWRLIPSWERVEDGLLENQEYIAKRSAYDSKLENERLHFTVNDIRYIIVKNEADIAAFLNFIRSQLGTKYTLVDMERLSTRILTSEQIKNDI